MNKRFSTIVAAAFLLGSGSVFAQTSILPRFDTKPAEKMAEVTGDSYIHIGGTVTEDGKDVNYVLSFAKDDKGTYLITRKIAVAITADPEVHPMSIDSALWLPTVTVVDGIKGYQFANKLNPELKLAVKYDSKAAKAYLVDPETEGAFSRFAWNPSSSDSLLCAYDNNKVRYAFDMKTVAVDETENVKFVKINNDAAKYSGAVAIAPEQTLLNAQDLNKINSNCFDLRVNDEVTNKSADDLNANSYIAYDAKVGGTLVGGVYLQAKGKSVDGPIKDSKGNFMPNKHIFLMVDTVFSDGASVKNAQTGRGLVITTDTIVCNWTPGGNPAKPETWTLAAGPKPGTDTYLCLDKDSVAKGRAAAHYRFYIYKNHAAINGEGLVVKVDSIPQLYDGLNNYAGTLAQARTEVAAKQDSIGFFAIDRVGDVKNPGLFTVIDSTALSTQNVSTLATVGFSAGSLAKLEKGVYSIKALEDKSIAGKGKYVIANTFNSDEAGDKSGWDWFADGSSANNGLVLAGQFYIDGVNGRFTILNRENGHNPFGGAQYINTTATADQYIIGGKKYEIKKLDVDMADPYVGYKHLTADESNNFAAKLKFNAPYAGDNLYIVVAEDGRLNVEKDAANRALQFKLTPVGDDNAYGTTATVKGKIDDGKMKRNAYRLVNAADETQVVALDGENFILKSVDADNQKADKFSGTLSQYKDSIAVPFLFRAIEEANGYELYVADTIMANDVKRDGTNTVYGTAMAFSGCRVDSLANYKLNVQGTNAYLMSTTLNTAGSGYFTLELPEEAAFVNVINSKPEHYVLASNENPTLAISIDAKNNAVLKAESELKAGAKFSDNFKLFVDTASMKKVEKPLFYIWTTRNVAAENVEKGIGNYLYAENGASTPSFVLAAQTGDDKDKMDIFNSKGIRVEKDVKVTDTRAAWAFASTTEKGVYKVQNNKSGKYLAQKNGILSLTATNNPFDGLAITLAVSDIPTGNESTEANTISVVAGEGNVTVYGAAGKKVIVSNVLGQKTTIVATSDSEVIAAPQGVVIVAVEGEAAVKAVVK